MAERMTFPQAAPNSLPLQADLCQPAVLQSSTADCRRLEQLPETAMAYLRSAETDGSAVGDRVAWAHRDDPSW